MNISEKTKINLTLAASICVIVFSAGITYARLNEVEKKVDLILTMLLFPESKDNLVKKD